MKIVIIGSSGQLGHDLLAMAAGGSHHVIGISGRAELDIADTAAVQTMLDSHRPDTLINTAAFHNVDLCESQPEQAWRINATAVRDLARACRLHRCLFVQIGTDYVVEGWPDGHPVPESAPVCPKSIYAASRFAGDCLTLAHAGEYGYVIRTCGLFGVAGCKLKGGLNFVDTMIAAARAGKPLRVVNDQIVAPTATDNLARQLLLLLERRPAPGLYHAVSHGQCSWCEFAQTSLDLAGVAVRVQGVSSSAYAAPAMRPRYSVLDNARLRSAGLDIMQDWRESLRRYIHAKYGPANERPA